ncbi:hypothetical protein [Sphingomonas sp. HMP6]|uniref:hypothetical protein n=1 Tax=Sphingomonas sp. HMP6 TaxID=1517551 RepID=UPI001596AC59|nr:hypothetical protein [Sphingomonas sp. HMP6]BCA59303.1 hypothetical protein HMP06_2072 [Sphingomonas sp. HMP6]
MRWKNTPEDEATRQAMGKALALVFIPAGLIIFGLIYIVSPRREPTSQAWANGTYVNACCPPVVLQNGLLVSGNNKAHYRVYYNDTGYFISVDRKIGVKDSEITLSGYADYVPFNNNSEARPAIHNAEALHLFGVSDFTDYRFVKK